MLHAASNCAASTSSRAWPVACAYTTYTTTYIHIVAYGLQRARILYRVLLEHVTDGCSKLHTAVECVSAVALDCVYVSMRMCVCVSVSLSL